MKRAITCAVWLPFVIVACSSEPDTAGDDAASAPAASAESPAAAADAHAHGDHGDDHATHTAADHAAHVAAGTHDGHTDADHAAHVAAAQGASRAATDPHAADAPARAAADPHAGHATAPPARPAVDPHAGHATTPPARPAADPHAGHATTPPARPAADPHAGHATPPPARPAADPHAGHAMPAGADPHAAHGHGVDLPATAGQGYTVADVRFMQMMMGHHAQAVVMSAMAPTHGAGELVLKLAQKIDISQRDEIEMMRQWLRERGQVVPTDSQMLLMQMPGMLTPAQMKQLSETRGTEFDILFLQLMIRHHDGAIDMVEELFASPGAAQDPDIFRFVTDVAADQGDEIFVMQRMLDMIMAGRTTETR